MTSMSREQVYLVIVEGWLRDNRGIVFREGSVDDLCDRIAAEIEQLQEELADVRADAALLRTENVQLKVQMVEIMGTAHNSDRWKS
jgi:cell division septum initiation protein DivIVA